MSHVVYAILGDKACLRQARVCRHVVMFCLLAVACLVLCACNGIFGGIYDEPADELAADVPHGFKSIAADSLSGTLFVNCTSYTRWTYINFLHPRVDSLDFSIDITPDALAAIEPEDYQLALHRSVPKTCGGSVAETRYGSVAELADACRQAGGVEALARLDALEFQPDQWSTDRVALDLSNMLQGDVLYLPSYYNPVLNRWLDIDISTPPPVYTPSHRAYILRLPGGECFALRLVHFRNAKNVTAWLTIDFMRLQ